MELFEVSWRRSGFGDSDDELQFRERAVAALERYWQLERDSEAEPVWFERSFAFKLGPHLLRGRVDRVDRHPDGTYELIDYKTGKAKTEEELREDVQLSRLPDGRARVVAAGDVGAELLLRADRREGARRALGRGARAGARDGGRDRRRDPRAASSSPSRRPRSAASATTGSSARPQRSRALLGAGRSADATQFGPRWRRKRWKSRAIVSADGSWSSSSGVLGLDLVHRALEPLDERLDLGVARHRGADLALVVLGGALQLAGVDGHAGDALERADERQRHLRVGRGGDVVRHRRPQARRRAARRSRTRGAARRRSRSGPRSSCARSRAGRPGAGRDAMPVIATGRRVRHVGEQRAEREHHARVQLRAVATTLSVKRRQRSDGSTPWSSSRSPSAPGTRPRPRSCAPASRSRARRPRSAARSAGPR